ncbi:MAG: PQQ-binding-like beta-propeller repeat protein [Thermoguttaceae bacterium]|nr:PQQ-binding-like beta-propeller repeat protein [Thermoguttaceae bacterium]MDW8077782.1 PQQ-binding-like beta-propeller repeat protein [Thermoguttaceae bacterium]
MAEQIEVILEPAQSAQKALLRALSRTGWVTAGLTLLVLVIVLWVHFFHRPVNPAEDPRWQELRQKSVADPQNEAVAEEFRRLDLALRRNYFWATRLLVGGSILALVGGVLSVVCWVTVGQLRQRFFLPGTPGLFEDPELRERREAIRALLAGTVVFFVVAGGVSVTLAPPVKWSKVLQPLQVPLLPQEVGAVSTPKPAVETPQSAELITPKPVVTTPKSANEFWAEYCRNWPRFRGPEGSGISRTGGAPQTWDAVSGHGVKWKVQVPLPGNSSPVIWGNKLFLTGATPERLSVFCFDVDTGALVWERTIPSQASPPLDPKKVSRETGFASPTPATDGQRVYVMFATGDVAALDFEGNLVWSRNLGVPDNVYGHAASLECFVDRVFVQFDQGSRPEDGKSRLFILSGATGEIVQEVPRPVQNSWASPAVVLCGQSWQLITSSTPWVIAYDPQDAREIWRFAGIEGDQGPSPVAANGVVYTGNEYCYCFAIRADGSGDVTATHLVWKAEENLPDLCSPLATDEFVFLLASWGLLTCYDAKTGTKLWEHELEGSFISSPGMAGELLYVIGEKEEATPDGSSHHSGTCWVVRPARQGAEIVAKNPLGEGCTASPAFKDGRLYIRGREHLFCFAN